MLIFWTSLGNSNAEVDLTSRDRNHVEAPLTCLAPGAWARMMQMQSSGGLLARVPHMASLCSVGFSSQYGGLRIVEFLTPV